MQLGLKDNFEFEGYKVTIAADGQVALEKVETGTFDLIILDVMLPKLSGFEVCKKVRALQIATPIVLLTAKGEEIDKVLGLELGADDYVTKPFSIRELLARVKAHLRRNTPVSDNQNLQVGQLTINFHTYIASSNNGPEKLSHKEFEILKFLYQHRNEVVTRYDLLEHIWGYKETPTTRTVDNFILRLRQKIEPHADQPTILITVHGTGYKLVI